MRGGSDVRGSRAFATPPSHICIWGDQISMSLGLRRRTRTPASRLSPEPCTQCMHTSHFEAVAVVSCSVVMQDRDGFVGFTDELKKHKPIWAVSCHAHIYHEHNVFVVLPRMHISMRMYFMVGVRASAKNRVRVSFGSVQHRRRSTVVIIVDVEPFATSGDGSIFIFPAGWCLFLVKNANF